MMLRMPALAAVLLSLSCPHLSGTGSGEAQHVEQKVARWWSADGWDIARIDTARDVDYLTPREKDMVLALNMARSNPSLFARQIVEPYEAFFRGRIYHMPGDPAGVTSKEGLIPVKELDAFLLQHPPLSLLEPSQGMSKAARDLANDQNISGQTGHLGSDGSDPHTRMNRYGKVVGSVGESNAYGDSDGMIAILDMLVDDGEPDRGHRLAIMESPFGGTVSIPFQFSAVGVAMGPHSSYGQMAVADLAGNYFDGEGIAVSFDQWRNTPLDTASASPTLSDLERDLILGVNAARAEPVGFYASVILPMLAGARVAGLPIMDAHGSYSLVPYEFVFLSSGRTITLGTEDEIEHDKVQYSITTRVSPLAHSDTLDKAASLEMDYRTQNPGALSASGRPQKAKDYLSSLSSPRWSQVTVFDIDIDADESQ
jgi:hypothetical protein